MRYAILYSEGRETSVYIRPETGTPFFCTKDGAEWRGAEESEFSGWDKYSIITDDEFFENYFD